MSASPSAMRATFAGRHLLRLWPLVWVLCATSGAAPLWAGQPVTLAGRTMGTTYTIKLARLPAGLDAVQLQVEVDALLEAVNNQMSTYRPDSELSRFNRSASTEWQPVSPELARVVAQAQQISRLTGGAFDVTVAPIVDLWNFGPTFHVKRLPSDAEIAEALTHVGYRKLAVRLDPPALRKDDPLLRVDLSAIAKGWGVDQVAQLLNRRHIPGFLVEIGGEIQAVGTRADGSPWSVGIEAPTPGQRRVHRVLPLCDSALATSGNYRNFFEADGVRYSHTMDPRTGRPVTHRLASVTVAHPSCALADALATGLMVLGESEAPRVAERNGWAALFLVSQPTGWQESVSPAFVPLLAAEPAAGGVWPIFLAALAVFAVAALGLGAGVLLGRASIRGSCGGLAGLRDEHGRTLCEACTDPQTDCRRTESAQAARQPAGAVSEPAEPIGTPGDETDLA